MSVLNIKSNINKLVAQIQDEELLQVVHDFLKAGANHKSGRLWKSLNKEQKEELLASYDDSEFEGNLTPPSEIFQ